MRSAVGTDGEHGTGLLMVVSRESMSQCSGSNTEMRSHDTHMCGGAVSSGMVTMMMPTKAVGELGRSDED